MRRPIDAVCGLYPPISTTNRPSFVYTLASSQVPTLHDPHQPASPLNKWSLHTMRPSRLLEEIIGAAVLGALVFALLTAPNWVPSSPF